MKFIYFFNGEETLKLAFDSPEQLESLKGWLSVAQRCHKQRYTVFNEDGTSSDEIVVKS